jgi:hypothetical protein
LPSALQRHTLTTYIAVRLVGVMHSGAKLDIEGIYVV